ncbi:MAG: sulfotransferase family 2 domain-containing protein [Pseudomonadota bacterium]
MPLLNEQARLLSDPLRWGCLDKVTLTGALGWAVQQGSSPVVVDLSVNGMRIVGGLAAQERPGTVGRWEFLCQWEQPLTAGDWVAAHLAWNGQPLANSPQKVGFQAGLLGLYSPRSDYAMYYHPKSACTLLRTLFIALHGKESPGGDTLDIDQLLPHFPPPHDRLPGQALTVVRNPFVRLVSAFLDKVVSWAYEPSLCTAHTLLAWRFGANEDRYGEFTFLDFLQYLARHRHCAEIHFQPQVRLPQPLTVCRVESLSADLMAFYHRYFPALVPQVEAFFATHPDPVNPSVNTTLTARHWLAQADQLPLVAIAQTLQRGEGIEPACFFTEHSRPLAEMIVSEELLHYGYRYPW